MTTIKVSNLSASKAEETIAKIWLLLEKHDIPSPKLAITSHFDELEVEFVFRSKTDAELLRLEGGFAHHPIDSNVSGRGHKEYA